MQKVKLQKIDSQATVTLLQWSVFEVQLPHAPSPTWHLCGHRKETGNGKVSSAIDAVDPQSWRCTTHSGNVYQLQGHSGATADAIATRGRWLHINHVQHHLDVTDKFVTYLNASESP